MSINAAFDEQELIILEQVGLAPGRYGTPRDTWFWTGAMKGDASGGLVDMVFQITESRKNDWVLSLMCGTALSTLLGAGDSSFTWNSGPIFRDPYTTGVTNPSWREVGLRGRSSVAAVTAFSPHIAQDERLVAVGEPHITGNFSVAGWTWDDNVNLGVYQVSMWGLLYDWKTFYRGISLRQ